MTLLNIPWTLNNKSLTKTHFDGPCPCGGLNSSFYDVDTATWSASNTHAQSYTRCETFKPFPEKSTKEKGWFLTPQEKQLVEKLYAKNDFLRQEYTHQKLDLSSASSTLLVFHGENHERLRSWQTSNSQVLVIAARWFRHFALKLLSVTGCNWSPVLAALLASLCLMAGMQTGPLG